MTILECRTSLGLSRTDVVNIIGVQYRTLQNWELGLRKCPDYVERLIVNELIRVTTLSLPDKNAQ